MQVLVAGAADIVGPTWLVSCRLDGYRIRVLAGGLPPA
jgi:hypothetical protein